MHRGQAVLRALIAASAVAWQANHAAGEQPHTIAITNVRIIPGDGPAIDSGTILMEGGIIVAFGESIDIPPYAETVDASGHIAYPGFIDAYTHLGIAEKQRSEEDRQRVEDDNPDRSQGPLAETRAANRRGIHPQMRSADLYTPKPDDLKKHRASGFTTALIAPRPGILSGTSILASLSDEPIRRAILIDDVAQHASFRPNEPGDYPESRLGATAVFRQFMYDARWHLERMKFAIRHPRTAARPPIDDDLESIQQVLSGEHTLVFEAESEDEIRRVLYLADEFGFQPIISGGSEAWRVIDRLKEAKAAVIVNLKFPEEPEYGQKDKKKGKKPRRDEDATTQPTSMPESQPAEEEEKAEADKEEDEADRIYEPIKLRKERRRLWEERVANAIELHRAGIAIAFSTKDFEKPNELAESLVLLAERGLPTEALLAALTSAPARMFGAEKRLGSIAEGNAANITVLDKPLGQKKGKVRWVFVDGLKFDLDLDAKKKVEKDDKEKDKDKDEEKESDEDTESEDQPTWRCEIEADRVPKTQTAGNVLLNNATVITMAGQTLANTSILVKDGKIAEIGPDLPMASDLVTIDATGKYICPGIIDSHSHIASSGVNEGVLAISAEVRIRDVLETRDLGMYRALAGGTTTALVLHGSSNPIGGQSQVIKLRYGKPAREMIFEGAPETIKFALGENVTQANWNRRGPSRFPNTRMGVEAVFRRSFEAANHYTEEWTAYRGDREGGQDIPPPRKDLRLDALSEVLAGQRWVHCHCYRADEILRLLNVAEDYGFRIACLQHVLEGYRVAPEIARHGCGASTFANQWAYKLEAYDAIPFNATAMTRAGICSSINSDSPDTIRYLQREAAKSMKWGNLSPDDALALVTINPARQLGIQDRVGSIEVGKDADLAIFNGHPMNSLSRCLMTFVDGEVYFEDDRAYAELDRSLPEPPAEEMLEIPAGTHRLYAITNATIHPMTADPIEGGTLLIRNDQFGALGTEVTIPAGCTVIDGTGLHVYPGLIDAGSTLGMNEIGQVASSRDNRDSAKFGADLRVIGSVNPHSAHIRIARTSGITTTLTMPSGGVIAGQTAVMHLNGWTLPEMVVLDNFALRMSIPSLPVHVPEKDKKKRKEEHQEQMREIENFLDRARRYAEQLTAAKNGSAQPPEPDLTLAAMGPYLGGEKPVIFSASEYKDLLDTIEFAEKHKLKPIIYGGDQAWKLAEVLAEKDIPVILNTVTSMPRGPFEAWDSVFACVAALEEAGVRFAFSTGSSAEAYDLTHQAAMAAAFGLSPERAEFALTKGAADILGIGDQLGSIEPGKRADLIITTHSPLQMMSQVRAMFIDGRPIDLTSKHTEDYERFRNRPKPNLPPLPELTGPPSLTR